MNKRLLAAAFAVALPSLAAAQEVTLPPIVITASRTAQTVDEALAAVTVITREDIERRPSQNVLELLRGTPGLTIINQGGAGKVSNVFLRGTESDHVLVLIDGVKIGGATSAGIPWTDLPAEQIERIEIVRGPRSVLYGSEAIGGVIQIFTRKGGGKLRPSVSVGYGSHDTYKATANLSGGGERGWFNLRVNHAETNGFNACSGVAGTFLGCGTDEPDDDGYRNTSVQTRLGSRFGQTGEIDFSALRAEGKTEFDGTTLNGNDFIEQVLGARVAFSPLSSWRTSLAAGFEHYERDYLLNGERIGSLLETTRRTLSWQNDLILSEAHTLILGADYQNDEVDGDTAYTVDSRDNIGVFVQYLGQFGRHSLQLAGRYDDNEQFGSHETGSISWGYQVSETLRGFVSYGTAFKAPTLDDLYFPPDPPFFDGGNPNLEPEESRTLEFGLKGRIGLTDWGVSIFRTDIDQLITPDEFWTSYFNIDEARILGLEASASTRLAGWTIAGSLTLLDTESRSDGANDGNELPRRPLRSARLDADRDFGTYSLGGTFFAASRSYDDPANTRELSGYGLLDLRAGIVLGKDWRLQAEVNNVFDKDYETSSFFNQPGRTFFVTLHYAPAP